ncbi:type I polyketide synthase [Solirubrobacter taibaiensis]|nr:type I polyketide synthase [Solirubrobacter taibaiensis]
MTDQAALLSQALRQVRALRAELAAARAADAIAVVGAGCRLPAGSESPDTLWEALTAGVDAVRPCPPERARSGPGAGTSAGLLDDVEHFDAGFFGIGDVEARDIDPQQRLALEIAWEAIEDAGLPLEALQQRSTGVFAGVYQSDYLVMQLERRHVTAFTGPGNAHSVVANRISYALGLSGPSVAVDTACSSSLVSVHLARRALQAGDCDVALAGGVNLLLSPRSTEVTERVLPIAPGNRCRPFDAAADGIVRGEGCVLFVLKRLADAQADGDRIRAVLRGSAVNHDGRTNGLTAPSPTAQRALIDRALADAGLTADAIGYVEAHGTGTPLGDPIEAWALAAVYGQGPDPCLIGSIKGNFGHLEACAGAAGLLKTILCVERGEIPATPNLDTPSPHLELADTRLELTTSARGWADRSPRVGAVSSFGFGGANVHVIVEQAPAATADSPRTTAWRPLVLPLAARDPGALEALRAMYLERLESGVEIAALAQAAARRRTHHPYRLAASGGDNADVCADLRRRVVGSHAPDPGVIAFVFSGQGAQWAGMGAELLAGSAVFRSEVRRCDDELRRLADWRLQDAIGHDNVPLARTDVAQLAIFAVQVGLVAMLRQAGVMPEAVVGHSVGEVTAAYVADALPLGEAVALLHRRGKLLEQLAAGGAMLDVRLDEAAARGMIEGREDVLAIAAVNAPGSCVLSGGAAAIAQMESELAARGVRARRVHVQHGFHSPLVAAQPARLHSVLGGVPAGVPRIPLYSTVTGARLPETGFAADHWVRNARGCVRFADAVAELLADGANTLVEVAPHPVLAPSLTEIASDRNPSPRIVPTMRRGGDRRDFAAAIARLYEAGAVIDWRTLDPGPREWIAAPRYPWQRRRYWLDGEPDSIPADGPAERPGADEVLADLRDRVAAASGVPATEIDVTAPADALGLDSLMVVELRNQVQARFGLTVPLSALLGGMSLAGVAERATAPAPDIVAELSDDEVLAALTAMGPEGGDD